VLLFLILSFYGIAEVVRKYSSSESNLEQLIPSFVVSILNQAKPPRPVRGRRWKVSSGLTCCGTGCAGGSDCF
jgi:hypothetical protein